MKVLQPAPVPKIIFLAIAILDLEHRPRVHRLSLEGTCCERSLVYVILGYHLRRAIASACRQAHTHLKPTHTSQAHTHLKPTHVVSQANSKWEASRIMPPMQPVYYIFCLQDILNNNFRDSVRS